jgi:membrane-bound lytic murein transglycosylase F
MRAATIIRMRLQNLVIATTLLSLLSGCQQPDSLADIQARGELVVVSRNSPSTYYLDKAGPTGFEYALAELLAQSLGVELRMETAYNLGDIFSTLQRQEADIAAAGLTLTEARSARFPHSIAYNGLTPQVIYSSGGFRPQVLQDLANARIAVLAGSSHVEMLEGLQQEIPALRWDEIDEADTMQLLELLKSEQAELAIIDSNEFAVQQSFYPDQHVAFDLGREQDMVWYLAPGAENSRLLAYINNFITRLHNDGTMARLQEKYFGHTDGVSRTDAYSFALSMRQTLPPYEPLIRRVATEYQMDWHLLAALAYQESHWDPKATSPTGVRGMMMLTEPTARDLGVENRLDVEQSLRGGARYFMDIKRRLPKRIQEPDRTWFALAAYNIGLAHLEDARILTQRHGGDPNLWQDVMERLPLLQKTRYYKNTRYGYARGMEAVTLVQNIRHYYSILAWQDIPDNQPTPPLRGDDYLPAVLRDIELQAL